MSEPNNDFWQSHSMTFLECAFRADRNEVIHRPDAHGKKTGDCGDTVEFFIILSKNRFQAISYAVNGCMYTNACANAVIDLARNLTIDEAWELTPEMVAGYLETLPEDHFHCAELAVGALYLTLADAKRKMKNSWKNAYR
jgi:nitrogen fixation NifU-like protein